jgi:ribulose-phosphate 3-epimerase
VAWLADSRVGRCIIHAEADDPANLLQTVRARGRRAGLALHPSTTVEAASRYVPLADYVVLLTVEPGAQGQPFLGHVLLKVGQLRSLHPEVPVYVDGGVNPQTLVRAAEAGCTGAAVGSYLWHAGDLAEAWQHLVEA